MSTKTIKLSKDITVGLKVKTLVKIGLMAGNVQNNAEKLGNIVGGLKTGDIMTLISTLSDINQEKLNETEIGEIIENSTSAQVDKAYDDLLDFFENSPLTSKNAHMIIQQMDEAMKSKKANK